MIIYIDEICPGNPLRPDKSRTLQAVYWAINEWPTWLLQRSAAWPCLGTIRSSIVAELPGKVSQLMKLILKVFWPEQGHSMSRGVTLVMKESHVPLLITCGFGGFLADEKAHNQVANTKGASGMQSPLSMLLFSLLLFSLFLYSITRLYRYLIVDSMIVFNMRLSIVACDECRYEACHR